MSAEYSRVTTSINLGNRLKRKKKKDGRDIIEKALVLD